MDIARYSMRKTSIKIFVATLFAGLVFLVGGVGVAVAQTPDDSLIQATNLFTEAVKECDWKNMGSCFQLIPVWFAYITFIFSAGILMLVGWVFDTVLNLSIDTTFINQDFVSKVWVIVRDFSNMVFIFVLLYTGIQTMFGMGDWKKTVLRVVIIALLINFSLFFTKVIIDAGNILAVGIYKSMGVKTATEAKKMNVTGNASQLEERSLSVAIAASVGPQQFLGAAGKPNSVFMVAVIFFIGAIVNILVAWALLRAAIIFIGRIIGFWFLMVISPFAFISLTLPQLEHNFHEWLKNILGLAFVAPVFLFFLYLIMTVLKDGGILASLAKPSTASEIFTFDMIFIPVIMVIFIYLALEMAVKYAKSMSGSFGEIGAQITSGAMGLASMAATGGVRALGSVGGGVKVFGKTLLSENSALARGAARVSHPMRDMTFDARNMKIPGVSMPTLGAGLKAGGVDMGAGSTRTLTTMRAEAVKKGEEKEKRKHETPESIAESVTKAKAKIQEQQHLKNAEKAEMTYVERAAMEKDVQGRFDEKADATSATENLAKELAKNTRATEEAAAKAYAVSDERKNFSEAETEYKQAILQSSNELDPQEFRATAKAKFDASKSVHDNSKIAVDLKTAQDKNETAIKNEKTATEANDKAVKVAKGAGLAAVTSENNWRRSKHADKVASEGTEDALKAASKIRKGNKAGKELREKLKEIMKDVDKNEVKEDETKETKTEEHQK